MKKKRMVVGPPPIKYLKKYASGGGLNYDNQGNLVRNKTYSTKDEMPVVSSKKNYGKDVTSLGDSIGLGKTNYNVNVPKKSSTPSYSGNSFGEAFAKARKELGANKVFNYNGKLFTTNYAEEAAPKSAGQSKGTSAVTKPTSQNSRSSDFVPSDMSMSSNTKTNTGNTTKLTVEEEWARDIKNNPLKYYPASGAVRTMDGVDDPIFGLLSGRAFGKLTASAIKSLRNLYKFRNLRTYNISGALPPPSLPPPVRANGGTLNTAADITSSLGGLASMIPGIGGVIGGVVSGIATPIMKSIAQGQAQRSNTNKMYSSTQMLEKGGMIKRKDGSYSKRGLWDNIRANKGSGRKPTSEMLKQERKIKKMSSGGTLSGRDDLTMYKGRLHRNGGIMVSSKGTPTKNNPAAEVEHNETRFSKGDSVYIFSDKLLI